jgi:hypothetical protein
VRELGSKQSTLGFLKSLSSLCVRSMLFMNAIALISIQSSNHAVAYVSKLAVQQPATAEIISALPAVLREIAKGSYYYEDNRFLIIQNRNPSYCVGEKCTTVLLSKCSKAECQYTIGLTGRIFAVGDSWTKTSIAGEDVFPLHVYCDVHGDATLRNPSSTFLIGRTFVILSMSLQDDCK